MLANIHALTATWTPTTMKVATNCATKKKKTPMGKREFFHGRQLRTDERGLWRDLHVMTQLQILGELDTALHGLQSVSLEDLRAHGPRISSVIKTEAKAKAHHVRQRPALQHRPGDDLRQQIEGHDLTRHRVQVSSGDDIHHRDEDRDEQTPHGRIRLSYLTPPQHQRSAPFPGPHLPTETAMIAHTKNTAKTEKYHQSGTSG